MPMPVKPPPMIAMRTRRCGGAASPPAALDLGRVVAKPTDHCPARQAVAGTAAFSW
jgi:hypothetical protein